MWAKHALDLDDRLGSIPIPVSFYFGDRDWMFSASGDVIVNKNPFKGTQSHVFIIENSDHHLYFDNPVDFANTIIQDLSNLDQIYHHQQQVNPQLGSLLSIN